jgi:hypothetical protein
MAFQSANLDFRPFQRRKWLPKSARISIVTVYRYMKLGFRFVGTFADSLSMFWEFYINESQHTCL